jgi:O-acetyl-ADP-ribose deacetylase (regulator of RNase III)
MPLIYVRGDATKPIGTGNRIITHCCNDRGFWNAGFVKALSRRWSEPERAYRRWAAGAERLPFTLGNVQFVKVEAGLCVANIIGQSGIAHEGQSIAPIRYAAIRQGLAYVRDLAVTYNASIHMPRMGAGLAGGQWERIAEIIEAELCNYGLHVTVYDYELAFGPDCKT